MTRIIIKKEDEEEERSAVKDTHGIRYIFSETGASPTHFTHYKLQ